MHLVSVQGEQIEELAVLLERAFAAGVLEDSDKIRFDHLNSDADIELKQR
jgi:hypothetical protein